MSVRVAVVTLSDSASMGKREDRSGPEVERILREAGGFAVVKTHVLPDDQDRIAMLLKKLCDSGDVDLVITTGGTGLYPRDVTPEATRLVIDREVPGIPELMRLEGLKSTPRAALSRGIAGIRGKTLIVNLPGSLKGVSESLGAILPILVHAVEKVSGDPRPCGETE